ncbi:MAG: radical SAM protein [Chloroflexi bacterium]|nr:radical SAM protein [Chloroflexota bacterium]
MIVREIACKSILTKSGIGAVDYAANPYVGCAHACAYCYATFMKRFTGHREEWGTFVDVKVNAAEVLARQLRRARPGGITFSTVTDAYQPLEEEYLLTQACLEVLAGYDHPVSILTKSALVLRDLDLIRRLHDAEVAFTITTLDDEIRARFEPGASPIPARLEALQALAGGRRPHVGLLRAAPALALRQRRADRRPLWRVEAGRRRLCAGGQPEPVRRRPGTSHQGA